jgi:cytochrome c oxidase subunit 1
MTAVAPHSVVSRPFPPVHRPCGSRLLKYSNTTALSAYIFTSLAPGRSERPFELHHPYVVDRLRTEAGPGRGWQSLQAAGEMATGEVANGSGPPPVIGTVLNDPGQTPT